VAPEKILQDILVTGRRSIAGGNMIVQREPETTNSITGKAISEKMSVAGPLQLINTLPGINTGQSDPYAMAQRSFIYVRGLPATEQGWIVEGAPAVDQAFFLPYSETWADPENLAGLTVIPGSSRITDPVQTAVGGEIVETIRDPSSTAGVNAGVSYGSYDAQRYFGRVDTGDIAGTGLRAFASGSYTRAGTFNLPGHGSRVHADFKAVKDWGETGKSSLFVSYSDWNSERSNVLTLPQFFQAKQANDFTIGNYQPTYTPGVTTAYYKQNYYLRKNILISSQNEFSLTDKLSLNVIPYYHWTHSNSPGQTSVNPASLFNGNTQVQIDTNGLLLVNGRLPARSNSLQSMYDAGVNLYAKYDVTPTNKLLVGWWYDHWNLSAINNLAPLDQNGLASDNWGGGVLVSTTGQVVAGLNYKMHTDINAVFISDEQSFLDETLKIDFGFRYLWDKLSGTNLAPGTQTNFSSHIGRALPRATISYDINPSMQVYGDVITSMRPPIPINTYPNTFNFSTGGIAQLATPTTKPEYAVGEELGYRYHDHGWTADVAVFNKVVYDRQILASAILNGAGVTTALSAGTEAIRGATAELSFPTFHGFTPYVNGQYLHAVTKDNFALRGDFLPTAGKIAPGSPEFQANVGVFYRHGKFFANGLFKWTDSQYATLMNDQKMPSFHTFDLAFGYYLPSILGKDAVLKVSGTNIGNKPYLSALSAAQPNAVATAGVGGTTIAGAAPTYFLGSPRSVMVTFSTGF
jgi:iron complex outermembrane receptor protein